jgi:hypothetical protein
VFGVRHGGALRITITVRNAGSALFCWAGSAWSIASRITGSLMAPQSCVWPEAPDANVGDAIGAAGRLVIGGRLEYYRGKCWSGNVCNRPTSLFVSQINGVSRPIEDKMHDFASAIHWLYLRCGI